MRCDPPRVAGIILAAGFSRRLGRPKQTIEIGGETLLQRAIRVAGEALFRPLIAVVRPELPFETLSVSMPCEVVENAEAEEGIAASIRAGILALSCRTDVSGAVILTCDQLLLTAEHLHALSADPNRLTASAYAGRRAVPAYFPSQFFAQLLDLRGDTGARELLRGAHPIQAESLELDIDTEEDVVRAREHFGSSSPG